MALFSSCLIIGYWGPCVFSLELEAKALQTPYEWELHHIGQNKNPHSVALEKLRHVQVSEVTAEPTQDTPVSSVHSPEEHLQDAFLPAPELMNINTTTPHDCNKRWRS